MRLLSQSQKWNCIWGNSLPGLSREGFTCKYHSVLQDLEITHKSFKFITQPLHILIHNPHPSCDSRTGFKGKLWIWSSQFLWQLFSCLSWEERQIWLLTMPCVGHLSKLCRASENSDSCGRAQRKGFTFKLWPHLCDLKLVHSSSIQRCEME